MKHLDRLLVAGSGIGPKPRLHFYIRRHFGQTKTSVLQENVMFSVISGRSHAQLLITYVMLLKMGHMT